MIWSRGAAPPSAVVARHSRTKDGVASARLCRAIQYAVNSRFNVDAPAYWIPAFAGYDALFLFRLQSSGVITTP
jgi:hypothetical protein